MTGFEQNTSSSLSLSELVALIRSGHVTVARGMHHTQSMTDDECMALAQLDMLACSSARRDHAASSRTSILNRALIVQTVRSIRTKADNQ